MQISKRDGWIFDVGDATNKQIYITNSSKSIFLCNKTGINIENHKHIKVLSKIIFLQKWNVKWKENGKKIVMGRHTFAHAKCPIKKWMKQCRTTKKKVTQKKEDESDSFEGSTMNETIFAKN